MKLAKVRLEERLTFIETRLMDYCEERSKISHELSQLEISEHRNRYSHRIDEIDLEIRILWRTYRWLAGADSDLLH